MELKDISYNFKYKDIENIWHMERMVQIQYLVKQ